MSSHWLELYPLHLDYHNIHRFQPLLSVSVYSDNKKAMNGHMQ